jgi:hypothetical protein
MEYDKNHCWQYDRRINTLAEDKEYYGFSDEFLQNLKVSDFEFSVATKKDFNEMKLFINRYEWLGKMSLYPTHYYVARYKQILGGVIIFDMPTMISKFMGEEKMALSKEDCIERLISRGACASWTPKCLASSLLMFAIRDLVKTTQFRIFSAYSDPEAKELGTIYQACNFYYLGNTFGSKKQQFWKNHWVSERSFRGRAFYKAIAKENNIEWEKKWQDRDTIIWSAMPPWIVAFLKGESKRLQAESPFRLVSPKHKYVYVLGMDNRETKKLKKLFLENTKVFPYPKTRGS